MARKDELIVLQHRITEQTLLVPLFSYLQQAGGKFKNFRLKGTGHFIAPPHLHEITPEHSADHLNKSVVSDDAFILPEGSKTQALSHESEMN